MIKTFASTAVLIAMFTYFVIRVAFADRQRRRFQSAFRPLSCATEDCAFRLSTADKHCFWGPDYHRVCSGTAKGAYALRRLDGYGLKEHVELLTRIQTTAFSTFDVVLPLVLSTVLVVLALVGRM
jgi:hypothetical protein